MGDLVQSHANLAQSQSRIYQVIDNLDERLGQLSRRQEKIVEILKLLTNKGNS